ncbi:AsmA family protein [Alcanivorax sp. 1008]|uniref:AsmA family protein n=1 Tax=Alcanivorax sp. 1008 TaxID=2816853 RepID=UPI001D2A8727|nr:AsmA family protein [Alcanivorax sp. 1008]MCC1495810.1 AsmA family protein [Alcanivorax sp. 1008]
MLRALKILSIIVLAIIILLAGAVFAVTRLIDPNDFKPQISTAAREQANLDLQIPGNLSWTFWPYLGIEVGRTEVRIAGEEPLFAAFDQVRTSIAVMPLLRGAVELSGLYLDGVELNLEETAEGANWDRIAPASETATTPEEPAAESAPLDLPVSIPQITISNGRVRYLNSTDGTDIRVEQLNIDAQDVSLDKPFPLEASLRYQDQADMRVDLALATTLAMNLDSNTFELNALVVDTTLAGLTTLPVQVHARLNMEAALNDDRISISDLLVEAASTRTSGNIELTQISTKPIFRGALSVAPFDANAALMAIGEAAIETSDPAALKKVAMEMTFSGPENSILLEPLKITLDNSTISGVAGMTDIDSGHIRFDLTLDQLAADGYLPPTVEGESAEEEVLATTETLLPPLSSEPLLPLEDLRALKLDGVFSAGTIQVEGIEMRDLRVLVRADNGLLEMIEANTQLMAGSLKAEAALDARSDNPLITFAADTNSVQIQPIMQMALEDDLFTGILDMNMTFSAKGNTEQALADSSNGALNLTLSQGTIRGMNLNNALGAGINDMLGQYQVITQFLPDVDQGRLPPALKEDTEVVQLKAKVRIEDLIAQIDDLQAELDRGTLSGKGFLNLRSQAFDMRMAMKVPELSTNKYIADRSWPMRCKGNLAGDVSKWCGADSKAFREIGKDITTQLAKDKLMDRFGIEGEGDSAEAVIKDAAKQKAKDELKKKAEEGLKKLFQ